MFRDHNFRLSIGTLAGLLLFGTVGYKVVEGWDWFTCFYHTVITLATVGYGEPRAITVRGQAFTVLLILLGVVTVGYVVSVISHSLIHSEILSTLGKRRLFKDISKLSEHFIICGAGRIGSNIIRELADHKSDFVVVETNELIADRLLQMGYFVLIGDATSEEVLQHAGVKQARALVCTLASDAENVYIALTARELNSDLYIVSKANEESAVNKLRRAGVNKVVLPAQIGSHQITQALLRPAVADFVELTTMSRDLDLVMEEIRVSDKSPLVGKALRDSEIRSKLEVIVIAAINNGGSRIFNPSGEFRLQALDRLVVIGKPANVKQLEALAAGHKGS